MNKLTDFIIHACDALGLHADIDFCVVLSNKHKLHAVAHIRNIGSVNGMLIVTAYEKVKVYTDELNRAGYGSSKTE